ncbi:MAG: radical SAM protein [bacterium]|nr:radical SAM protein [bacterium]
MTLKLEIREIQCKSALGKCGFPGGGLAVNPYVGCSHACAYCYARFMKRFTGHQEEWGSFVDARINIAEVLARQIKSLKFRGQQIYIGTVTDPYQPMEGKYKLTRQILEVLNGYDNPVSLLTKSSMVIRDLDILKQFKKVDVNFTINTLDEKWKRLTEPFSPTIQQRFEAAQKLTRAGIKVFAMMGPYWPIFTDPEKLFKKFKKAGISRVFTESFNTIGGNWTGVEKVLKKYYPKLLPEFKETMFNPRKFFEFYNQAEKKIEELSKKYHLPVTIYFERGHAAKKN